jgi:hypothetical protein
MDLPLLLSAFSSLVAAFVASAVWATRPTGASRVTSRQHADQAGRLPT